MDPSRFIGIDYDGNIVPCCDIRGDNPLCKDLIFGNILNESILNIFNKRKYREFREIMKNGEIENYPSICKFCEKGPSRYTGDNPGFKYK
jgi:radical SAM protein with 4Fe4S-binding SPASM domain